MQNKSLEFGRFCCWDFGKALLSTFSGKKQDINFFPASDKCRHTVDRIAKSVSFFEIDLGKT